MWTSCWGVAAHKSKAEIDQLIAARFPRPEVPARVQALSPLPSPVPPTESLAPGRMEQSAPGRMEIFDVRPKAVAVAPQRFALQVTIGQNTHDKLRYAQALLSHQLGPGDVAEVLDRALDALIPQLEKTKFAATRRPRSCQRHSKPGGRYIPADVKRRVWERDGGQCTFTSESGRRCPARTLLEFDHIDEVARGGQATVERIRLRCRAHNQYGAERTFGTAFMHHKRQVAQRAAATARAQAAAEEARAQAAAAKARTQGVSAKQAQERDVIPWLRKLGFRADEARRAAAHCEDIPNAPLEERVRVALSFLAPAHRARNNLGSAA